MDGVHHKHHKHRNISSAYLYETDAQLYSKQRSQSSVLVKQAKKNSFKMLSSICSLDLFCACANKTRGEEHFFTCQQNASADRLFSSVFFFNVVSMFFLILCNILRSVKSRKAFKCLSKRLVVLLYGNQFWSMRSPGGGE